MNNHQKNQGYYQKYQRYKKKYQNKLLGGHLDQFLIAEIDEFATHFGDSKFEKADKHLLRVSQGAAAWSLDALKHLGRIQEDVCTYCNDWSRMTSDHLVCDWKFSVKPDTWVTNS